MLKKITVVVVVIAVGLFSGYFYGTVRNYFWPPKSEAARMLNDLDNENAGDNDESTGYISKEAAVDEVKKFPPVRDALASGAGNEQPEVEADQEPSADSPVWVVEVKERRTGSVPKTTYYQVDAVTGRVLDLLGQELKVSGVSLKMSRREVNGVLGKAKKAKRVFDKQLGQSTRVETYDGLDVVFDSKGLVLRVTAAGDKGVGPRGLKVGSRQKEVTKLLGLPGRAGADGLEYYPADAADVVLLIKLDQDAAVKEIIVQQKL